MKKSLSLKIARIVPLSVTSIGMLASSVAPALAAEMPPPNVNTTEYADSLTDAFFVEVNAPNFADKQVYENEALDFIQLNIGIKDTAFADVALKGYTILHNHIIVAEGLFDDDSDDVHEIATTPSYAETSSSGEYTVMITYEVDGRKHVYNYGTVNLNVTSNQERVETEIHDGWQQAFSSMTQTRQQPTRVASQNAPVAAAVQATQVAQTSSGLTNAIMTQVLTKMAGNPLNNTQVQILSNSTEFFLQQSGRNNLTDVQLGLVTSLFSETLAKSATEPLSASRIYDYSQTLADLTTDLLNQTQALDTAQSVVLGQLLGNATAPFNDQSLPIDTVDFLIGTLEELNFSNLSDSQTQIVTRILSNTIMQNSIRTSSNGELDTIRQNLLLALDEIVPSIPDNLTQAQISAISSNLNRSFRPVVDSIAQLLANGQMSQAHSNVLVQSLVSSARASIASVMNVRSPRRTIPPRGNNSRNGQQSETVSEGNGNVANNPTETPADNPTNNRPINPPLDPSARPPITTPDNDLPTVTPPISDIEPPIDVLPPRPPATTPDNEMPTVDSDDIPTVDPDNELPTVEPPILDTDNELATVNPDDIPTVDPDSELPTVNPGDIPPLDRPPVRPPFVPDNELPEVDLPTIDPDNDLLIVRPPFIKPDNELPTVDLPTIDPDNDLPIVRPPFIKPDNELPTVDLPTIDPDNELPIVRPPFIKPDNELPTVDLPTIDPDNDLPIVRPPRPPITPENELPEVELPTIDPDNDLPIVRPPRPPITPENELPEVELPTIDPDNDLPIVRPPRPPITPENELPEVDLPTIEPDNDLPIVRPSRPPITPENELPEVELPTIDPDNELPIVRPPRPPITPENKLPEVELPILAPDSELPTVNPDDIPPIDPIRPPNPPTEIDNETADDSEKPWWNNQDNAHLRPGHPDYVDNNVDKPITTPAPPIATVPPRTPTAALHDISTVTWAEDDATSHNIYVDNNLVESDYTGSSYDLRNLSLNPGLHEIQVSASNNAGQESEPSDSINYVVWHFE